MLQINAKTTKKYPPHIENEYILLEALISCFILLTVQEKL